MKNLRSGLSNILVLVFLVSLVVVMIAFLSSRGTPSAGFGSSPVPTAVGVQVSPLSTPTAVNVPVARLGEPVLVHASGPASLLSGDQQRLVSIGRQGDQAFTTLHDLATGQERKIADDVLPNAHLSGHWLVGEDRTPPESPGYYSRIKVIDMDTGRYLFLGDKSTIQQSPSISGNIVVWKDWRNKDKSGLDIYGYDLIAGKEFPVVVKPGPNSDPRISGQWVIYVEPTDQGEFLAELRAHSLADGEDFLIGIIPAPNNASNGTYHAIDGDKVAWVKVTDAVSPQYVSELHLYDLTTRTDRTLTEPIPNRPPTDISLSAKSGLVVYNSPTQHWVVLDSRPSVPVPLAVTEPIKSIGDHLMATGDYLVWRLPLNHDTSDVKIFAVPVTR